MTLETESLMLRVYCVVSDEVGDNTLHDAIVETARREGLAGSSAFRAKMGFSRGGVFYSHLSEVVPWHRQPVIVEIIDQPDRIEAFLPILHELVRGRRLITVERAEVILYRSKAH